MRKHLLSSRAVVLSALLTTALSLASIALTRKAAPVVAPSAAPLQANIELSGVTAADKAQRGRALQAAVVANIPGGYHINANRPLGKYAVPTVLQIEAPGGIKVTPVTYPRANVRRFSFSNEQLAVYEGRAVMRFNIAVPANYNGNDATLRARLRYQSCNDEACFPPTTREVEIPISIAGANEAVKRTNTNLFGGGGARRGRR